MRFAEYIERKNCFAAFSDRLLQVAKDQGYNLEVAGADGHGNNIYRVILNPDGRDTVAFIGGIHGDEKAGPLAILNFLHHPPQTDFRVLLLPVVNPHGFSQHIRRNAQNRDLNRNWCDDDLCDENKAIVKSLDGSVRFLATLHEDSKAEGFYLYYSDTDRKPLYDKLVAMGKKIMPLKTKKTVYGDKLDRGLAQQDKLDLSRDKNRCCLETFFWKKGIPYLTVETPVNLPVEKRVLFQRRAMDFTLSHLAKKSG